MCRKVLVVEDEPSIRNILNSLLGKLGLDTQTAQNGSQAIDILSRDKFDAVLLNLRCADLQAEAVVTHIEQIRPSLVGRVLVITGEVPDARAMALVERHFLPHVTDYDLLESLRRWLQGIFGIQSSPRRVRDASLS